MGSVGVHDFTVETRMGDTQAIAFTDYGGSVEDGENEVFGIFAAAEKRENAVVGIVGVDPFETVPVEIDLMEGGFNGVKMVEIRDEPLDAAVGVVLEEVPVKAAGFGPLVALGEFLTHKEEFLSWVSVLIGVEEAKIGELLPQVAGHFVEQRVFAMNDFIVGEGEEEIFGEGVEEREGEFIVLVFAMDGVV